MYRLLYFTLTLFLSFAISSCSNTQKQNSNEQSQTNNLSLFHDKIVNVAEEEIEKSGVPSLQIAVGQNGKLIFNEAFGLSDIENNVQATTETRYRSASMDKWLTATAAFRLVESGKLDLDVPIQEYCPDFPRKEWPITTRQLLTHTSGIRHNLDFPRLIEEAKTEQERNKLKKMQTIERLGKYTRYTDVITPLDNFKNDKLLFEPGTDYSYSSFGYRVLGCVIQGASERPFREIMKEEIFAKASMTNIVEDDAWAVIPNRASGYFLKENGTVSRASFRDVSENLPAGGHLATAKDFISFVNAFQSGKLVSDETQSLMTTAPVFAGDSPFEPEYGYGVELFNSDIGQWIAHTGSQSGATSIVVLFPADDISLAIMSNAYGWRGLFDLASTIRGIIKENSPSK